MGAATHHRPRRASGADRPTHTSGRSIPPAATSGRDLRPPARRARARAPRRAAPNQRAPRGRAAHAGHRLRGTWRAHRPSHMTDIFELEVRVRPAPRAPRLPPRPGPGPRRPWGSSALERP